MIFLESVCIVNNPKRVKEKLPYFPDDVSARIQTAGNQGDGADKTSKSKSVRQKVNRWERPLDGWKPPSQSRGRLGASWVTAWIHRRQPKITSIVSTSSHEYGQGVAAGVDMLDGDLDQIFRFQVDAAGLGQGTFDHVCLEQDRVGIAPPLQYDGFLFFADSPLQVLEQPIAVSSKLNPSHIGHGLGQLRDNFLNGLFRIGFFKAQYCPNLSLGNQIKIFSDGRGRCHL